MARKVSAVPTVVKGFNDYFDSGADVAAILQVFGYTHRAGRLTLPRSGVVLDFIAELERKIEVGATLLTLTIVGILRRTGDDPPPE
ncbi:MAG: hypothetical protein H7Y38_17025 [Armatimonadetes bacterium]|nr:hypothetical protein [Armatimonadota bacterium]